MIFLFIIGAVCGVAGFYFYDKPRRDLQTKAAQEIVAVNEQNKDLFAENARLKTQVIALEKAQEQTEKNQAKLDATYKAQFAELASKILDEKSKGLETKNTETLRPLTQHLESFFKRVDDMERAAIAKQAQLDKGLADLLKSNEKIDQSAVNLANAIKGEAIVRGSWGEEALKHILESAGMKAGVDFFEQVSDEGKRVDVQIALPNNRWIVVDSKTIFNHYMAYFNEHDPKKKEEHLDAHVKDVKKTIRDLSSKKYYEKFQELGEKVQPDYTLMFVYPESALLAAVSADPDVLQEAWKNNIALVSATSLMSALKMISKMWDIDKQQAYMDDFKEDLQKLLEKFNDFLVNFAKTEQAVINAVDTVKVARGHIDGNRGAILPTIQRMIDVYESPLTKENSRLLKRMKYDYNGWKKRAAKEKLSAPSIPAELPAEPSNPPDGLF